LIEARIAVALITWVDTGTSTLIIIVFIEGPRIATSDNSRSSKVIIIQARGISISILFQSHVEVVFIQVDGVIFVAIRSPYKSDGRG